MDLISKKLLLENLEKRKEYYRSDTDIGNFSRSAVQHAIEDVESDSYKLFSLNELGESDLNDLKRMVNERLNKLTGEPTERMFVITGINQPRYTRCHEKAKVIFQEEVNHILDYIEDDYCEGKASIDCENIKQSNLCNYDIE